MLHFGMLTDSHELLKEFSNILPKLKFALELEEENQIIFVDITLKKSQNSIQASIYREPFTTDCMMSNRSFYPTKIKLLALDT
jgi:hypothetical protein